MELIHEYHMQRAREHCVARAQWEKKLDICEWEITTTITLSDDDTIAPLSLNECNVLLNGALARMHMHNVRLIAVAAAVCVCENLLFSYRPVKVS